MSSIRIVNLHFPRNTHGNRRGTTTTNPPIKTVVLDIRIGNDIIILTGESSDGVIPSILANTRDSVVDVALRSVANAMPETLETGPILALRERTFPGNRIGKGHEIITTLPFRAIIFTPKLPLAEFLSPLEDIGIDTNINTLCKLDHTEFLSTRILL